MFFFLFLFSLHAIKVNKIVNSNTAFLIIQPNNRISFPFQYEIFDSVNTYLKSQFNTVNFINISHKDWNEKYGIKISENRFHIALFRYNTFVEFYNGIVEYDNFLKYATLALISHAIVIKQSDLSIIFKTKKKFFILQNDHIYYEYENAAFLYKYSSIPFYFINGTFSLIFYDVQNKFSKKYDFSRSMTIFIKSCAYLNKNSIKKFYLKSQSDNLQNVNKSNSKNKQYFHLFAITNTSENSKEINYNWSSLKSDYFLSGNFSITNWSHQNSIKIQERCLIKPNKLTYAISYSINKKNFCYFYPYEKINDINHFTQFFENHINNAISSELLFNLSKINSLLTKNKNTHRKKKISKNDDKHQIINSILDHNSSVFVFVSNPKSPSNNKAFETYYLLKYRMSLLKGIKFMTIDSTKTSFIPYFIPNNDNFPMFVMFEKNDRHPHVFQNELTNDNILNFALKYISKNKKI